MYQDKSSNLAKKVGKVRIFTDLVYNIPYGRAPRLAYGCNQPLGRVRRASKGISHTSTDFENPGYNMHFKYCISLIYVV